MFTILSSLQTILAAASWFVIITSTARGIISNRVSTLTLFVLASGFHFYFWTLIPSAIIVHYAQKSEHNLQTRLGFERYRTRFSNLTHALREYSFLEPKYRYVGDPHEHLLGTVAVWATPEKNLPFEMLQPLDMSKTIESFGPMRKPLGLTKFMKEIGWQQVARSGLECTNFSNIIEQLVRPIRYQLPQYDQWQATSSMPEEIFELVLEKIDFSPKENHSHHTRLHNTYSAIADHLKDRGKSIRRLRFDQLFKSINPKGSMGRQERDLGFANIGDYLKATDVWQPRVEMFKKSLRDGKPIMAYYNTQPKREKKTKKRGRLIWFLCGTGRIHESITLGDVDSLLFALPYSVKKMSQTDYGEALAEILTQGKHAVCDDVSGWDTKVSYTILCMEANFLRQLAQDEEHKREIWDLYRLYAYPMVSILRSWRGKAHMVLYQLQGQVASGRRVTYSMNTITNIVVTLCRAAISQGVSVNDMYQWTIDRLDEGHSNRYGGKISGDDSVIILSPTEAKLYASIGGNFMDDIGMPRKGIEAGQDSTICRNMTEISFCSHDYTLVKFANNLERWIPVRSITEIIARASIRIKGTKDEEDDLIWARRQGSQLLLRYFHIPTIRIFALAILSATPEDIVLNEIDEDYNYFDFSSVVWISEKDIVRAINRNVFGSKTNYKSSYRISRLEDLAYIASNVGEHYDILSKTLGAHESWIIQLRKTLSRTRLSGRRYTDWLSLYKKPQKYNGWRAVLHGILESVL